MINICNAYQDAALLNAFWNVIGHGLSVVIVSSWTLYRLIADRPLFTACPCHIDCIDGCNGCENPICFCDVSWNYQFISMLFVFKDDSNADNQEACFTKNSKTLGQCILDCNDESTCEAACVSAFKNDHSECPCQVCRMVHSEWIVDNILLSQGKLPTGMSMWQLRLQYAGEESDFDTLFRKFKITSSYPTRW